MFLKIEILKNFAIFIAKYLCWSLFLITLQAWRPSTLSKRDSNTSVFRWILRVFKNTIFTEHLQTNASEKSYTKDAWQGSQCGALHILFHWRFYECIMFSSFRGGSRTAATSKMKHLVIIVKPLTIITKSSILEFAALLDPPFPILLH